MNRTDLLAARALWMSSQNFDKETDLCARCQGPAIIHGWLESTSLYDPYREVHICLACDNETRFCKCEPQGCRNLNDVLSWIDRHLPDEVDPTAWAGEPEEEAADRNPYPGEVD